MVGRIKAPKDMHLNPLLKSYDKGDIEDVIPLRVPRWVEYPGLPRWAPVNTKVLTRWKADAEETVPWWCGGRRLWTAIAGLGSLAQRGRIRGMSATSRSWKRQRNRVSPFQSRKEEPHCPRPEGALHLTRGTCWRLAFSLIAVLRPSPSCSHSDSKGRVFPQSVP